MYFVNQRRCLINLKSPRSNSCVEKVAAYSINTCATSRHWKNVKCSEALMNKSVRCSGIRSATDWKSGDCLAGKQLWEISLSFSLMVNKVWREETLTELIFISPKLAWTPTSLVSAVVGMVSAGLIGLISHASSSGNSGSKMSVATPRVKPLSNFNCLFLRFKISMVKNPSFTLKTVLGMKTFRLENFPVAAFAID